ncbi:hypothetical protein Cni_G15820 [Canna indica]|uniref:RNase H type-1 domain-containing protein n=1 Tax=Canna indica TaxID=4628 RepID=A0AAQ3KF09_9LILI|nr:hypothetical protein Cni_G15820 [Canna indica]
MFIKACRDTVDYGVKNEKCTTNEGLKVKVEVTADELMEMRDGNALYCDASWKDDTIARVGYVIANQNEWKIIGACLTKAGNALKAELNSIRIGLETAVKKKFNIPLVYSDCKVAIMILLGRQRASWDMENLVRCIHKLGETVEVRNWVYVNRKRNEIAYAAARLSLYCNILGIWSSKKNHFDKLEEIEQD